MGYSLLTRMTCSKSFVLELSETWLKKKKKVSICTMWDDTLGTKDLPGSPEGMVGIQNQTGSQVANYHFLSHAWKICSFFARSLWRG